MLFNTLSYQDTYLRRYEKQKVSISLSYLSTLFSASGQTLKGGFAYLPK